MNFANHAPVMEKEIVETLSPKPGGVYVDATFGGGGYTRAILKAAKCTVYGFDRDPTAISRAKSWAVDYGDRLHLINRPFSEMEEALKDRGVDAVDGVVFDLGVSSMQLDEPERGFSFRHEGRLSMRMDGGRPDAADVIAKASARELAGIFKAYGEEKKSGRISRAIIAARDTAPIATTTSLAAIIEKAAPVFGASKIHPATRVFQAIRIFVNDELGQLIAGLRAAERLLKPAGKLVVVTFHSLEDRIVKRFFAQRAAIRSSGSRHAPEKEMAPPSFQLVNSKAALPTETEVMQNPRARSAKLRAGIRLDAQPVPANDDALGAPRIIELKQFLGREVK